MPNVTIDITGQNSGGAQSTTPSSDDKQQTQSTAADQNERQTAPIDQDSRLIDDLRKMLADQENAARHTVSQKKLSPLIDQVEQAQRQQIADHYESMRQDALRRMNERYKAIDEDIDKSIDEDIVKIPDDEGVKKAIEGWEEKRNERFETAGREYDEEIKAIDEAQIESEEELKRVIEELTEEIRNNGGDLNYNSFLSQLKRERQQAIADRDSAEDEETAREAASRVRELDDRIKDIERGGGRSKDEVEDEKDIDWGLRTIQTIMGFDQIAKGIAGRDLGAIIMGGAQTATSALGLSDKAAAKSLAWIKPIATIGTLFTQEAEKSDQLASLAALVRQSSYFGEGSIGATREELYRRLWNYSPSESLEGINAMGLSAPEFAQSAAQRIKQRGISEGGVTEAYYQEALERVFSLNQGALGAAGKYDLYGMNATDALSNLVARLSRIENSGVSQGNYAGVQKYFEIQQSIMGQLSRFSDKPNIGVANKEVEAFARLKNYTVDDRTINDIAAVRNTIISPQNDRMKALLYGTVEELMPEVAGRADLIDRAINDPLKQGEIIRAYMQKIQNMYGDTDTGMGYWAGKALLSSIESPERRDAILKGLVKGEAGQVFANGPVINGSNLPERYEFAQQVEGYTSELTSMLVKASDGLYASIDVVGNLAKDVKDLVAGTKTLAEIIKQRMF